MIELQSTKGRNIKRVGKCQCRVRLQELGLDARLPRCECENAATCKWCRQIAAFDTLNMLQGFRIRKLKH